MSANTEIIDKEVTPGQAAKQWAKAHPDFIGILSVFSYTFKGRGGWGITTRHNDFIIKNGKCAAERSQNNSGFNGQCEICGELYFELIVKYCLAIDPDAGKAVPIDLLWSDYREYPYVFSEYANIKACPSCADKHGLIFGWKGYGPNPRWEKPPTFVRKHPDLYRHSEDEIIKQTLDLRKTVVEA